MTSNVINLRPTKITNVAVRFEPLLKRINRKLFENAYKLYAKNSVLKTVPYYRHGRLFFIVDGENKMTQLTAAEVEKLGRELGVLKESERVVWPE